MADLKTLDHIGHACLAQSRPDGSIPLGCIEGIQIVPHSAREHYRVLHMYTHTQHSSLLFRTQCSTRLNMPPTQALDPKHDTDLEPHVACRADARTYKGKGWGGGGPVAGGAKGV